MNKNLSTDEKRYLKGVLSFAEAEKYIKKFNNKIFVIKYGGSALTDRYLANNFARDVVLIKKLGINIVIVHGGGPQISETLKKKKLKSKFIDGLRVTDKETLRVVKDVLLNRINKKIVQLIRAAGGKAVSLPGNTNNFIQQLVDECGTLCEPCSGTEDSDGDGIADECDDCHNMSGDVNDDIVIDVLDIVLTVNMILSPGQSSECAFSDADIDGNTIVNILDVIQIINFVIG